MTVSPKSERDCALDFMRAVAIVLVVFGHVQRGLVNAGAIEPGQPLFQAYLLSDYVIYTFHVPVFFVVSGLLLEAKLGTRASDVMRRILQLLGLYLIWNTLNAAPAALFSDLINRRDQDIWSLLNPLQPSGIMWFFVALICAHVAYLALGRIILLRYAVMAVAAFVLGLEIDHLGIAYGCLWLFAGTELGRTRALDRLPPSRMVITASFALFVVATAVSYRLGVPTPSAFVSCAAALACLYALGQRRSPSRLAAMLGRDTLAIYVMHVIAAAAVRILMLKMLGPGFALLILVAATAAGIGLPLLASHWARQLGLSQLLFLSRAPSGGRKAAAQKPTQSHGQLTTSERPTQP